MKYFPLAFVILALSASVLNAAKNEPSSMPNIVIILADDLGYGDVQCYNPNRGKIATPHIDRLAAQGMRFTDAHSSSGVCSPSRYTLLTGRYHWRTRLQSGIVGYLGGPLIASDRLTIAGLAKQQGYHTACVGKWHLGMDFPGEKGNRDWSQPTVGMPLDRGFDYYYGVPASLNYGVLAWFEGRHAKTPPIVFVLRAIM